MECESQFQGPWWCRQTGWVSGNRCILPGRQLVPLTFEVFTAILASQLLVHFVTIQLASSWVLHSWTLIFMSQPAPFLLSSHESIIIYSKEDCTGMIYSFLKCRVGDLKSSLEGALAQNPHLWKQAFLRSLATSLCVPTSVHSVLPAALLPWCHEWCWVWHRGKDLAVRPAGWWVQTCICP